jgi:hypothetical protein
VTFDPDYASDTGLSVRTIGWSDSAGFLITVITVRDENDHLWGATRSAPTARMNVTTLVHKEQQ